MKRIKRSLWLLRIEAGLTAALIVMPVITSFYANIGMSLSQIGLSQAVFTIVILFLNIPAGWLADRFSPKWVNVFGDGITAVSFVLYAFANSFGDVVIVEVLIGIGMSLSRGADAPLRKAYCEQLGIPLSAEIARVQSYGFLASIGAVLIGGVIGSYSPQLAMLATALPFAIATICVAMVSEAGERLESNQHSAWKHMCMIIHATLCQNRALRWYIIAHVVGTKVTHPTIWVLTPLLLQAHVPLALVGFGWACNLLMGIVGARLAQYYADRLSFTMRFALPMLAVLIAMSIMSISVSLETVWVYGVLGIVRGWMPSVTLPMVQNNAPNSSQATVVSIADTVGGLLYAPLVWGVNSAGTLHNVQPVMLVMVLIFAPLMSVTTYKLFFIERS